MPNKLTRYEPFREMLGLREMMNRWFDDFTRAPWITPFDGSRVAVDVMETGDDVIVKAEIPGLKAEEVDISLSGDMLTIKGETKSEQKIEEANYVRQERRFGAFERTLTLPTSINADKAKAEFENGVLTLTLPKAEGAKPRVIKVKAK
jgi:HSP20 family protein